MYIYGPVYNDNSGIWYEKRHNEEIYGPYEKQYTLVNV